MNHTLQQSENQTEGNWLKLHRSIIESPVFQDPELLKLWIWVQVRATYRVQHVPMKVGRGTTIITLQPGQLVTGRNKGAEAVGMPASSFRNRLRRLEKMGFIKVDEDNQWSIVSVTNWLELQQSSDDKRTSIDNVSGQPKDNHNANEFVDETAFTLSEVDNQRTTKGQPKDTYKKDNNTKKDKKERNKDSTATDVAERDEALLSLIQWWNTLKERKLVAVGANETPSKGVIAGWKRVQKSQELRDLLEHRSKIEAKLQQSKFVREGAWFDLPKLLGGTNSDGEYSLQKLLNDGYADSTSSKPKTANVASGVNYDPNRSIEDEF